MKYLSVCSGIEAATAAWEGLGWEPLAFAETDRFAGAVLKHHYPDVVNLGDIRRINGADYRGQADLLAGGTPCQSFSVAGKRLGFGDPRGDLTLEFVRLAAELKPVWLVWENVPNVLFIDQGQVFKTIIEALAQCGYWLSWRILDAQYFGVPQRRRRVFVVGHSGNWRCPPAVLFEPERRGRSAQEIRQNDCEADGAGHESGSGSARFGTLTARVVRDRSNGAFLGGYIIKDQAGLRTLTPAECERLMGFPDNYTLIPGARDGSRYRVLGNSMAVPVMRWLGRRIAEVHNYELQGNRQMGRSEEGILLHVAGAEGL